MGVLQNFIICVFVSFYRTFANSTGPLKTNYVSKITLSTIYFGVFFG